MVILISKSTLPDETSGPVRSGSVIDEEFVLDQRAMLALTVDHITWQLLYAAVQT